MYSAQGLKRDNLRLCNAHTFISTVFSLCHIGAILALHTCVRVYYQIRTTMMWLSQAIAHTSCYTERVGVTFQSVRTIHEHFYSADIFCASATF